MSAAHAAPDQGTHPCPSWCDPRLCRVIQPGERLHSDERHRFVDDAVRVSVGLVAPEDRMAPGDPLPTYVDVHLGWPEFQNCDAAVWLTLAGARELYDQLGARLYAAYLAEAGGCAAGGPAVWTESAAQATATVVWEHLAKAGHEELTFEELTAALAAAGIEAGAAR